MREVVSLAAAVSFDCACVGCACVDIDADDVLFFQVGTMVYIDRLAKLRSSYSRSNGSNMLESGSHTYALGSFTKPPTLACSTYVDGILTE